MAKRSAGILLYRRAPLGLEVFLVHPGGPFWERRDAGAWSIPKGECQPGEDALAAARREFAEETGLRLEGEFMELGSFRQSSAKTIEIWAVAGDADPAAIVSNTFEMEWPPKSGRVREFPEVDRAAWFSPPQAERKILKGQLPVLETLYRLLRVPAGPSACC